MSARFYMPPEWHRHDACWMAWPNNGPVYRGGAGALARAQQACAGVAHAIARFEPVKMMARAEHVEAARELCGPDVDVFEFPLDDAWARDTAPTFVIDGAGGIAGIDWQFNNYGNKQRWPDEAYEHGRAMAGRILARLGIERIEAPLVLEGGSIHVDGEGTLLTTEQCLLNPNRNPQLSRTEIEDYLKRLLGVKTVIWLGRGVVDDDTDGHVDEIATFAQPGVVLALISKDPADVNYAALQDNLERLRGARDARGRELEIVEIEQPEARRLDGERLSLSYVNFYLANGGLVMPSFEQPKYDEPARQTLGRAFRDREIVQVPALDIFAGGGGVHCITQQQPAP